MKKFCNGAMSAMILSLLLALAQPLSLLAADQTGEEKKAAYTLDEVVVTATRSKQAVKDVSATVEVITREEIEASNANSCTEVLEDIPGIFVHKTGDFGRADVDIRGIGGRGRSVMVLVDGRPVKMGLYGCTVTHSLPIDNIERIEVVKGPASVLYGSDALGGVINIITIDKVEGESETTITASGGTHNTQHYQLHHGMNLGKFNYFLSSDARLSNGHVENSAYEAKNYTARIGCDLNDDTKMSVSMKYYWGYKEEPLPSPPDTWNDYRRGAVDVSLEKNWGEWLGALKVYRNQGEHVFSDGWHSEDYTNGAVFNVSGKALPDNEVNMGLEFRQQGGERLSAPVGEWDKYEYAFFLHDEQEFFKKLTVVAGGRLNVDEISGTVFCPKGGLVYDFVEGTIVRGQVSKGFRSPQISDLYLVPPSNDELKAEEMWNYEVGINQRITERVNVDISGFIMKGENMIEAGKNSAPPPMFIFQNTGEIEFRGGEVTLDSRIGGGLQGKLSYAYLDPGEHTQGRPRDKVNASLDYRRDRLTAHFGALYVANYYADDDSQSRIDDYLTADAKLSYNISRGLKVFSGVKNLGDVDYKIFANLPGGSAGLYGMSRRTVHGGMSYKF